VQLAFARVQNSQGWVPLHLIFLLFVDSSAYQLPQHREKLHLQ
jgi:hypothetical protein